MADINGTDGNDVLNGTDQADRIDARGGDDRVLARGGNDAVFGGAGRDYLVGQAGFDRIEGGVGDDRLFGGGNGDLIRGGAGADFINGDPGNDTLFGGAGGDTINGGVGDDRLVGDEASGIETRAAPARLADGTELTLTYGITTTTVFGDAVISDATLTVANAPEGGSELFDLNDALRLVVGGDEVPEANLPDGPVADGTYRIVTEDLAPFVDFLGAFGVEGLDATSGASNAVSLILDLDGAGRGVISLNTTVRGAAGEVDDVLTGGPGRDFLEGGAEGDRFVFDLGDFRTAAEVDAGPPLDPLFAVQDFVEDFNPYEGDVLDLSRVLIDFDENSDIADYVSTTAFLGDSLDTATAFFAVVVDPDGAGDAYTPNVTDRIAILPRTVGQPVLNVDDYVITPGETVA